MSVFVGNKLALNFISVKGPKCTFSVISAHHFSLSHLSSVIIYLKDLIIWVDFRVLELNICIFKTFRSGKVMEVQCLCWMVLKLLNIM